MLPKGLGPWITLHLSPRFRWRMFVRNRVARRYLAGHGLEVGGLIMPVRLPAQASAQYVDAWTNEQLRTRYPQYRWLRMVPVDLVADGQKLQAVTDSALDFLIANHVIEHCPDPIGTIETWLQKLRPGGILYMAVPDKRRTFDRDRPLTRITHLLRDYREGPTWSEQGHWEEFVAKVLDVPQERRREVIESEQSLGHRPHYHVWTPASFEDMLGQAAKLGFPFHLEEIRGVGIEFIVVLRRT